MSHDVQAIRGRAGGVGSFVTHWAELLRDRGDEVTIVLVRQETEPVRVDESWRRRYRERGIGLLEIHNAPPSPWRWSDAWPARLSERVAPHLAGFDAVYLQDWANPAFFAARAARFRAGPRPALVTVLHGPSGWIRVANGRHPRIPEDLHVDLVERYAARHSDAVIAPSRYIVEWARRSGFRFREEPRVLGLPYRPGKTPPPPVRPAGPPRRLVFFGRLEPRKGLALLADALRRIPDALAGLEEIVLLGDEDAPGDAARARTALAGLGVPVVHRAGLDREAAGAWLAAHADHALAVVASPVENLPYAVIEASLVPGLNVLASRGGGIPEIFGGGGHAQLFEPTPHGLAAKLRERLRAPLPPEQLAAYDFEAANARWLAFHREILERGPARPKAPGRRRPSVDVCIPYYDQPRFLPQLLRALEAQTEPDLGVVAVDDGSRDPAARAVFDAMARRYRGRGWTFVRQPHAFVDAARNRAARHARADWLLFVDADDLPLPHAAARLLDAARLSGDDCFVAGGCLFEGEAPTAVQARYLALGPDLVTGLVDPVVFGPSMFLVRRAALEAVGGFRERPGAAHEDWELVARLLLAGFACDAVPEVLFHFRRQEGGLSRTSDDFAAKRRLVECYEEALAGVGLHGLAGTAFALHRRCQELEAALRRQAPARLRDRVAQVLARRRGEGGAPS